MKYHESKTVHVSTLFSAGVTTKRKVTCLVGMFLINQCINIADILSQVVLNIVITGSKTNLLLAHLAEALQVEVYLDFALHNLL